MKVCVDVEPLKDSKWYQYAVRFLFGGVATVIAGLIAEKYGAVVGGLFLAFPVIFPASATLIEIHEREKKEDKGKDGDRRAIKAAGCDAAGAALGSLGLVAFGIVIWCFARTLTIVTLLLVALVGWLFVATLAWRIRKTV